VNPSTGEPLEALIDRTVNAIESAGGIVGDDRAVKQLWNDQWAAWVRGSTVYDEAIPARHSA
jgi:hypothetical protein